MLTRAEAMAPSTFVVSVTPFTEDGALDEEMLRAHFRRLAAARIGVYVGGSGSGEGLTLSHDETFRLYRIAHEELNGRVPVRAMGFEPNTAGQMVELARIAREAKLEAMQVYSVVAAGATAQELEQYFSDVLSVIRIPAVISIHHAVGYTVPVETLGRIVERYEHVVGINCTRADIRLLDRVGSSVAVHVADASQILSNLALGGHGFLSNIANIVPELCVSLINCVKAGDLRGAARDYAALVRLDDRIPKQLGIKGIKGAMRMLGMPAGYPRRPRLALTGGEQELVRKFALNFPASG